MSRQESRRGIHCKLDEHKRQSEGLDVIAVQFGGCVTINPDLLCRGHQTAIDLVVGLDSRRIESGVLVGKVGCCKCDDHVNEEIPKPTIVVGRIPRV